MSVELFGKTYIIDETEELLLPYKSIDVLPETIGLLTNLRVLQLNNNNLTSLPESIGKLTNLMDLHLHSNKLTSLPYSIKNLTKLRNLYAYGNKLQSIPDSICELTNLSALSLANNQLKNLPENIGNLINLRWFVLHRNNLTILPPSIKKLKREAIKIQTCGYQIDNLDPDCEFIIVQDLKTPMNNLPINLKQIYLDNPLIPLELVKVPFGCKVIFSNFYD
jgi:Leucine-rich repeat (LRR) protein